MINIEKDFNRLCNEHIKSDLEYEIDRFNEDGEYFWQYRILGKNGNQITEWHGNKNFTYLQIAETAEDEIKEMLNNRD
jgi:hypothetical protein